jgi:flagellar biosynthesis GTPase FlhF
MNVQQKQRFLIKVFMGLALTSSVFHAVKAAGIEFESTPSDNDYYRQQLESLNTESVKNKDIMVFLGNTGSGKGTSIRFDINKYVNLIPMKEKNALVPKIRSKL